MLKFKTKFLTILIILIIGLGSLYYFSSNSFAAEDDPAPSKTRILYARQTQASQSVNVAITQIDPSKFPTIEVLVQVTNEVSAFIPDLTASNFQGTEQSEGEAAPTTEKINVRPIIKTGGGIAVAIVIDRKWQHEG